MRRSTSSKRGAKEQKDTRIRRRTRKGTIRSRSRRCTAAAAAGSDGQQHGVKQYKETKRTNI